MNAQEQPKVRVSFDYCPDEPDPDDSSGLSEDEYMRLMDQLQELGAENVSFERQG